MIQSWQVWKQPSPTHLRSQAPSVYLGFDHSDSLQQLHIRTKEETRPIAMSSYFHTQQTSTYCYIFSLIISLFARLPQCDVSRIYRHSARRGIFSLAIFFLLFILRQWWRPHIVWHFILRSFASWIKQTFQLRVKWMDNFKQMPSIKKSFGQKELSTTWNRLWYVVKHASFSINRFGNNRAKLTNAKENILNFSQTTVFIFRKNW